ncbi:MAG: hypothetical protein KAS30_01150, partial [Candidatus Diapherotrites archaeon]|nr:hypothetical protein [Candidatus Diapherotrites archaeon]
GEKPSGGNYSVKEFVIQAVKKELSFVDSNTDLDDYRMLLKENSFGEKQLKSTLKKLMGPIFYQKGLIFVMTDIENPDNFVYCLFHDTNENESSNEFEYCKYNDIEKIEDISRHISNKINVFSASAILTIPINQIDSSDKKTPKNSTVEIPTYIITSSPNNKRHVKMTLMLWDL